MVSVLTDLVLLARALGNPPEGLAILAEGNVSASNGTDRFWVKASGASMTDIGPEGFVEVRSAPVRDALDSRDFDDAAIRTLLASARVDPTASAMPSVETFMHAYLLSLHGVQFVAHTHPEPLLALLSLDGAEAWADERLFPDEIVLCGPASVWVPYVDPGLRLARRIRDAVESYLDQEGEVPKSLWLQNHGLITLGATPKAALGATLMAAKAARVRLGALQTGRPLHALTKEDVMRIHTRPDEHYRQRRLA
jgi:rhamnose utilization protein RhaD (predicted bifunctional aldolase and dehydrogenase)